MIRVNLLPTKKRAAPRATREPTSKGSVIMLALIVGWLAVGGGLYLVLDAVAEETVQLKAQANKDAKKIKALREIIDEERLKAIQKKTEQLRSAREKLEAQRRSPVWVMHEMANILTEGKSPDIDAEKHNKAKAMDPRAELDASWDASSVWIIDIKENKNGILEIEGGARDASDLHEFVKRLRASARFGTISHPHWEVEGAEKRANASRKLLTNKSSQKNLNILVGTHVVFNLTARVNYWD